MENMSIIVGFIVFLTILTGVILFLIYNYVNSSADKALENVNTELSKANRKQAELSQKLREADEELNRRRAEAKSLADKMRTEAEQESQAEREKIVGGARKEAEEIILKAQGTAKKLEDEIKQAMELKTVDCSLKVLEKIFSEKNTEFLEDDLIANYITDLKDFSLDQVGPEITEVEILTSFPLKDNFKSEIDAMIKTKLGRALQAKLVQDKEIGAGIVLKFGSMTIDGSLKVLIRETAAKVKAEIEEGV